VFAAAVDYAEGRSVTDAPPSLRVYTLAKRLPGLFSGTDLLDGDGQLLAELTVYVDEEGRVANENAARQARENRDGAAASRNPFRRRGR